MINKNELNERLDYWADILGLSGWDIKTKIVDKATMNKIVSSLDTKDPDPSDIVMGAVVEHYPAEQAASIVFLKDADKEFGLQLNIDTLILHELIHVVVGEQFERLPKVAKSSPRTKELEEFICDFFARKLYKAHIEGEE